MCTSAWLKIVMEVCKKKSVYLSSWSFSIIDYHLHVLFLTFHLSSHSGVTIDTRFINAHMSLTVDIEMIRSRHFTQLSLIRFCARELRIFIASISLGFELNYLSSVFGGSCSIVWLIPF